MSRKPKRIETQALIIGAGVTGAGIARDLTLRGVSCVLAEKRDVNAGASGGNHGLLHSGARYVASDMEAATECREEGALLKRLAPHCVDDAGGLFVAVEGDDERYVADFPAMCARCGIEAAALEPARARELEPALSGRLIAAYKVPDASVDPFMLSLDNIADAGERGMVFLANARAAAFTVKDGRIVSTLLFDDETGEETEVVADQVINASGAWAGIVARLAGLDVDLVYSKGTLLVTQDRIADMVINRLRKATDADILVPGGTVSILGTTSVTVEDPEDCRPTIPEVDHIIEEGAAMVPVLETTRYIRAYAGVRPLFGKLASASSQDEDGGRGIGRGFALLDHARDGVVNFATITGGKLTTYRLMAEKAADLVCEKLGVAAPCLTRETPLPSHAGGKWTEPGLAPRTWLARRDPKDALLCECEMVSKGVVDELLASMPRHKSGPALLSLGLRSRIGKGPCQGGFCSLRVCAHLYDRQALYGDAGIEEIRAFLGGRWRGVSPILWGFPLMQAEFQEALHCGLMGLELHNHKSRKGGA